jgi:UDP-N-acetylglucosamine--N-acetylmuramyl-(pentapeptide) pyrophosphoryl-undecaprenol N-acetylglucosamine transferase
VLAAARWSGVPSIIQEQNSVPGVANRLGARLARVAAVGFEEACERLPGRCVWTGNPVREEFFVVPPLEFPGRRVLLFGGSQGSRVLNRALTEAAPRLAAAGIGVLAQSGEREAESVRAKAGAHGILVVPFLSDIWNAMARADLVVCRAGALTLAELCAAGRPSLLVPFAAATHGHQEHNARALERAGAAVVISEEELSGDILSARVAELLSDPARLRRMGEAARSLAKPGADDRIVDLLFEVTRIAA